MLGVGYFGGRGGRVDRGSGVEGELLAGNIVGLANLRGAVVSHISALAAKYRDQLIEAEVMNFFRFRDETITYRRNVHDSKPFAALLRQISGG